MANGLAGRSGWGWLSAMIPVTKVVAAANVVQSNVGASISVVAGKGAIRLTKLSYRVDLAPDVAVGSAVVPIYWRLVVFSGTIPPDISALQAQAFPTGAHPEIPSAIGIGAPVPLLHDLWLDFSAGDPGLNALAPIDFADSGPSVGGNETMNIALFPIIDGTLGAAPLAAANAILTLGAWGTGVTVNPNGGGVSGDVGSRSLPRYDVALNG